MNKFEEVKHIIAELSEIEKRAIYYLLAESYGENLNGIVRKEGVRGGRACVGASFFSVCRIEMMRRYNYTDEGIFYAHPQLTKENVRDALAYTITHKSEIDKEIKEHERED